MNCCGYYKREEQKQGPDGRFARSFGGVTDIEVTKRRSQVRVQNDRKEKANLTIMLNTNPNRPKIMKHSLRGKLGTFWKMGICSSRVIVRNFLSQNVGPRNRRVNRH